MTQEVPIFLRSDRLESRHGFFTRLGGVSRGPIYGALQCGFGADEPVEHVRANRDRAMTALGAAPERLATLFQHHSAEALTVEAADAIWPAESAPKADGLATRAPGVALGVLTADCAPVLFEDRAAGVIGACHAGWRGALFGVLEATLDRMTALGAERGRIRAAIGPCIGPNAYEVGPEFEARFLEEDVDAGRFFYAHPDPAAAEGGQRYFDLPAYVAGALAARGVRGAAWIGRCTYAEPRLFYSNRRAVHRKEPDYGRLLSAIAL